MALNAADHNPVHSNENWRQRIVQEEKAKQAWNDSWGFMCANRKEDSIDTSASKQDLDLIVSKAGPCYHFLKHQEKRGQTTRISVPGSKATSRPASGTAQQEKSLFLDAGMALAMQPQTLQGVGCAIQTPGIDPAVKYKYPVTSQHTYGWNKNSLEFFGVAQYGKSSVAERAQFDE